LKIRRRGRASPRYHLVWPLVAARSCGRLWRALPVRFYRRIARSVSSGSSPVIAGSKLVGREYRIRLPTVIAISSVATVGRVGFV